MRWLKRHWMYGLSGGLAGGLLLLYLILAQITPFGTNTLLTFDLDGQYMDFFIYFKHALLTDPSSIIYSKNMGFGNNMIGVWSYYLMSPFNLLFLAFKTTTYPALISIMYVGKLTIASMAMIMYLRRRFPRLKPEWDVLFSLAYAFNGWTVTYYLNIMWLDVLILLPFVMIGILKLLHHQKPTWYLISITLLLCNNYYMAYMVILFTLLIMIYEFVVRPMSNRWNVIGNWILANLIATMLSLWLLLPTFQSLLLSKGMYGSTDWSLKWDLNPFLISTQLITGTFVKDDITKGWPHIFVGAVVSILMLTFFINPHISLRRRLWALGLTGFFILSFSWRPLTLVWHMMQLPNWYWYRWSFLFTFWLIDLAAMSLTAGIRLSHRRWGLMAGLVSGDLCLTVLVQRVVSDIFVLPLFMSIILTGIGFMLLKFKHLSHRVWWLLGLTVFDLFFNLVFVWTALEHATVSQVTTGMCENAMIAKQFHHTPLGYRNSSLVYRTLNGTLSGNYPSGDGFSSLLSYSNTMIASEFNQNYLYGVTKYTTATLLGDALLGMKQFVIAPTFRQAKSMNSVISSDYSLDRPDLSYYSSRKRGINTYYKNPNAFSIGLIGNRKVRQVKDQHELIYENHLTSALLDQQYTPIRKLNSLTFKQVGTHVTLRYRALKHQYQYLSIQLPGNLYHHMILNGRPYHTPDSYTGVSTTTISLPIVKHDRTMTITLKLKKHTQATLKQFAISRLDMSQYRKIIANLKQQPFKVTQWSNLRIQGQATVKKNQQAVLLTVPYDPNWTVMVDGHVKLLFVWQNMIGVAVPIGHHRIQFQYRDQSLIEGIWISITVAALLWSYQIGKRIVDRRHRL